MDKRVIISVKGTQLDVDNEPNIMELITEGTYYKMDGSYFVTYKESQVTGMEGTTTTLKLDGGVVTLMRTGSVNSHFVFQKAHRHFAHYDTEYGAFTVSVYANEVDVKVDEHGGEIRVAYQMEIDSSRTGMNDFYMLIREAVSSDDKYNRNNKATG